MCLDSRRPARCDTLLAASFGSALGGMGVGESLALQGRSNFWNVLYSSLDDVSSKASMYFWSPECTGCLLWDQGKGPQYTPKPCSSYMECLAWGQTSWKKAARVLRLPLPQPK